MTDKPVLDFLRSEPQAEIQEAYPFLWECAVILANRGFFRGRKP